MENKFADDKVFLEKQRDSLINYLNDTSMSKEYSIYSSLSLAYIRGYQSGEKRMKLKILEDVAEDSFTEINHNI